MSKLLCKLGFHKWKKSTYPERVKLGLPYTPYYSYKCARCGKVHITKDGQFI